MGNENGTWIMHGLPASDPGCLHTAEQLTAYIDKVGFLPLFRNRIPGFSVEEHTESGYWWSGDRSRDPWEWREILAESGQVVYGKFFDRKAGFISVKWLPFFVNARRDGYDFDSRWEEGKAPFRQKRIMDTILAEPGILSNELKQKAGFGKGGEKNFDGVLTELQMQTYLCVQAFRRRINKQGKPYGWPIAVYAPPEAIWGYKAVTEAYAEDPARSLQRITEHMQKIYGISAI